MTLSFLFRIKYILLFSFYIKLIILIITLSLFFSNSYAICGDGICSTGLNVNTCPQDCIAFRVENDFNFLRVIRGEEVLIPIRLIHTSELPMEYFVNISPSLEEIITLQNRTIFFEERGVSFIYLNISDKNQNVLRNNIGTISISNDFHTTTHSLRVEFLNPSENRIRFRSNILSSEVATSQNLIYELFIQLNLVSENLLNQNAELSENVTITLDAVHSESGNTFRIKELDFFVNQTFNSIDSVKLNADMFRNENETFIYVGQFELLFTLDYNGIIVQDSSLFTLRESFTDSMAFDIFLLLIILSQVGLMIYYSIKKYIRHKKATQRYITPNLKDLPNKNSADVVFEVGLVAETRHKAYIVAKDINTHALVAGSTGSGKSVSSSIIAEEALNNKIPVVVFDPTSQWTGFLSALRDKNIFKVYSKFGLTPEDARSYKGLIFTPKDKNFDINFDEYLNPGEITVFNLAHLSTQDYDDVTEKIINSIFKKGWEESPDLKLLCVFDEVHRLLDSSCEGKGYAALTKGAREFRKWGIGLLMASQVSSDFKEAIGGNVLTEVQLNTKNLDDIKKAQQKYGIDYGRRIARQGLGVAMVQNPRYNNGKPWFINFRPPLHNPHKLSDEELELYNNYTYKLKLIKIELQKLKEKGQDITDFELDFNLANNKLKEGKFKMSDIYIQGLMERLNISVNEKQTEE